MRGNPKRGRLSLSRKRATVSTSPGSEDGTRRLVARVPGALPSWQIVSSGRDHDLRARADVRSKLVPATHGLELRGGGGALAVNLVDRRVYALRDLFRLAA